MRYRPAGRYQEVGGDWYDAFAQPDGATALVIGDVVGHDVEATAAMSQIRSMLRALVYDQPGSPAHVLAPARPRAHRTARDTMATALWPGRTALCRVRGARGARSAGRRPATRPVPAQRRWRGSRPRDPAPAAAGHRLDGGAPHRRRPTGPGDILLLFTDGLLEQGRVDLDRGTSRLTAALAALPGCPSRRSATSSSTPSSPAGPTTTSPCSPCAAAPPIGGLAARRDAVPALGSRHR